MPLAAIESHQEWIEIIKKIKLNQAGIEDFAEQIKKADIDLIALFDDVIQLKDEHCILVLLFSTHIAEQSFDARYITQILTTMNDQRWFIPIIQSVSGDKVLAVVESVATNQMSVMQSTTLLLIATVLLEECDPPAELLTQVRKLARKHNNILAGISIGHIAILLNNEYINEVAGEWLEMAKLSNKVFVENLRLDIQKPIYDTFPDDKVALPGPVFTARRTAQKIGRNELCPCGSGKKYKRCCLKKDQLRLADPSPVAGVTMTEYKANAPQYMTAHEFYELSIAEMIAIGVKKMPTPYLIMALRKFERSNEWGCVDEVNDELALRSDFAEDETIDDHRLEIFHSAKNAKQLELAEKVFNQIQDPEFCEDVAMFMAMMKPNVDSLSILNQNATAWLNNDEYDQLLDCVLTLLDYFPALGIIMGRGVLDAKRDLDSWMLLDSIEEARDILQLSPGDPAADYYEYLLDQKIGHDIKKKKAIKQDKANQKLIEEVEVLRNKLRDSANQTNMLAQRLEDQKNQLSQMQQVTIEAHYVVDNEVTSVTDIGRMKNKISELKGLIKEGHDDRLQLRKQLGKMSENLTATKSRQSVKHQPDIIDDQYELQSELPLFSKPLIPIYSDAIRQTFETSSSQLVGEVLLVSVKVAEGNRSNAMMVKRLKTLKDIWSARIGIKHRLLFRFNQDEGELVLLDVVERKDFEKKLKTIKG